MGRRKAWELSIVYRAGKFNVLVLNSSCREMGRQYGELMGPQMKGMSSRSFYRSSVMRSILDIYD